MRIFNLQGQIAFITGGSSGIGLAIAKSLAARGANVVIFSRGLEKLQKAAKEIAEQFTFNNQVVSYLQLDVSDRTMCEKVLQAAVETFGPPKLLVNCAGISFPQKFEVISFEKFIEIMKINLNGTWNTIDILLPQLKHSSGYIVNVSSIAGLIGVFGMTAYSSSKYAVIGLSEALCSELKKYNITVSVLCPPDVNTPMLEKANRIKPAEAKALSSTADIMEPEEVAESLIKSLKKGRFLIIPNTAGKYVYTMKRWFPSMTERIIARKIRRAASSEGKCA